MGFTWDSFTNSYSIIDAIISSYEYHIFTETFFNLKQSLRQADTEVVQRENYQTSNWKKKGECKKNEITVFYRV